jgi:hypothetical protein
MKGYADCWRIKCDGLKQYVRSVSPVTAYASEDMSTGVKGDNVSGPAAA